MESDHASKVREARDARRKRILAKSSERLAYITGEGKNSPLSSPCASFREFDPSPEARKSDVSRSLGFQKTLDEPSDQGCPKTSSDTLASRNFVGETNLKHTPNEHAQESSDSEENAFGNKKSCKLCLASGNTCQPAVPASLPVRTHELQEYSSPLLDNLSRSIHDSLLRRVICAACVAVIFVCAATLLSCGHPWGVTLNLDTSFWPIAVVLVMDFVLVLGGLLVSSWARGTQQKRFLVEQAAKGTNSGMWDIVAILTEVIVAVSLDCGIYVSLEGGGLLLARYCLSTSCGFNWM